ncbi:MAG: ATPase [Phycisphaerae bacterium]|nr:ATPase [Phycisphaerae bacterium]|tara:strand:+ start:3017 stop:3949 length:933 start_codon:yes stop_codon:yes gene_type:complete
MDSNALTRLRDNVTSVYLGNTTAVDRVLTCLLARGHVLIEDVPGVGKTVLASSLAKSIDGSFSRIQCTPDLLPADVTGITVYERETTEFQFKPGPIFHNVVVADEINRTTPRTQSAMLEAMSESTVSIDGVTRSLPAPFMVIATQNPYEFEGTYFLPENQLDRFLMRIALGYPAPPDECRVLEQQPGRTSLSKLQPVINVDDIVSLQKSADDVKMDQSLLNYIVAIATATRNHEDLQVGLSPRGSLALSQAAKATAILNGRDYCVPEDIVGNIVPICAHRIISRSYMHDGDTLTTRRIMQQILETVASPA